MKVEEKQGEENCQCRYYKLLKLLKSKLKGSRNRKIPRSMAVSEAGSREICLKQALKNLSKWKLRTKKQKIGDKQKNKEKRASNMNI